MGAFQLARFVFRALQGLQEAPPSQFPAFDSRFSLGDGVVGYYGPRSGRRGSGVLEGGDELLWGVEEEAEKLRSRGGVGVGGGRSGGGGGGGATTVAAGEGLFVGVPILLEKVELFVELIIFTCLGSPHGLVLCEENGNGGWVLKEFVN